jgi:hypothetical protein
LRVRAFDLGHDAWGVRGQADIVAELRMEIGSSDKSSRTSCLKNQARRGGGAAGGRTDVIGVWDEAG